MTAYWGYTQLPLNQGVSNNTGYESLLGEYTSKLNTMPSTESGGYLSQVQVPQTTYPTMPAYSLGRERALQQQYGAPASAKLNQGLLTALTTARNRPFPAQSYLTRESLAGYGEGLTNIMSGALNPAQRAQMQELEYEKQGLLGKYSADYQSAMLKYQQDYNTALMKEKERNSLISAINEFKIKQALTSYQKNRVIGAGPAQAQVSLLNQIAREGKGTPTPEQPITNTPTTTPTNTGLAEWRNQYGGG